MQSWAAWGLAGVSLLGVAINLYFWSLFYPLPARLAAALTRGAAACGIEGGSCRRVAGTSHARLFGGLPNVAVGLPWSLLVLALAVVALATGAFPLWWPCFLVAVASVGVSLYLVYVLLFVLHDPCPL
jgi:uncharacterized membrane protein